MRASPILAVVLLASAGGAEARRDRSSLRHHRRRQPSHTRQTHPPSDGSLHRVARGGGSGDAGSARLGASLGEILVDKRGYSSMVAVRGGDKSSNNADTSSRGLSLTPQAIATLAMAACMSLHYLSYSLARPATMTLFTSSRLGFGGNVSAYPLAMTFISPMSFVLLLVYGGVLNRHGPLVALKATTLGCAGVLGISALLISRLAPLIENNSSLATLTKYVVGALFVFRESYVQLITSQHWSFISSVLTPGQSSTWFAPISGLTSVTSALAAMGVGKLSNRWGLTGVLATAAAVLGASVVLGEMAYAVAEKNGFNPADEHERKKQSKEKNATTKATDEEGLITKARDVFARVPTLWALFCEILACQGLSTLLNVCCVTKVSQAVPDDAERAGWMGNFFATVNVLSCILQFGILPATSSFAEPSLLWKGMPMIMLAMTASPAFPALVSGKPGNASGDASLNAVASAFLVMKTLEFSVRRMLDEMVYVPLDYESRFLGKEVIGVLGYRFGKSAASLALSAVTSMFGAVGMQELSYFATGASGLWLAAAWRLGNLVPTRKEADEAYERMKKEG